MTGNRLGEICLCVFVAASVDTVGECLLSFFRFMGLVNISGEILSNSISFYS